MSHDKHLEKLASLEKEGYNDFVDLWTGLGRIPTLAEFPGKDMPFGEERQSYIRGYLRAKDEVIK